MPDQSSAMVARDESTPGYQPAIEPPAPRASASGGTRGVPRGGGSSSAALWKEIAHGGCRCDGGGSRVCSRVPPLPSRELGARALSPPQEAEVVVSDRGGQKQFH